MIEVDYLKECFSYDAESGDLRWKFRPEHHFSSKRSHKSFNTQFAGKAAGVSRKRSAEYTEYIVVSLTVDGKRRSIDAHRICFAIHHGRWPALVDHKDGCGSNNSAKNLIESNRILNGRNSYIQRNNTSGISGVSQRPDGWVVYGAGKPKEYLGFTSDFFLACCLRKSYELRSGYSKRHGSRPQGRMAPAAAETGRVNP